MTSGPATRNGRGPMRPASVPIRVDSIANRIPVGRLIIPDATGE